MSVQPDEQGARGCHAARVCLGLLCFIPMAMYLLAWCFVANRLPRAALWAGAGLCVVALVTTLHLSAQEDGDAPQ